MSDGGDAALADDAIRDWLGAAATRTRLDAMNSSAWLVASGRDRFVLKISRSTGPDVSARP